MAFALSSLLNPTANQDDEAQPTSTDPAQDDSSSSPAYKQQLPSPELIHAQLPKYTPPQRPRPSSSSGLNAGNAFGALVRTEVSLAMPRSDHAADHQDGEATSGPLTVAEDGHDPQDATQSTTRSPEQVRALHEAEKQTDASLARAHAGLGEDGGNGGSVEPGHTGAEEALNTVMLGNQDTSTTTVIKQEADISSRGVSPADPRHASIHSIDADHTSNRNLTSLKQEHASRTQSPLRESSIALPSTEASNSTAAANMKKRTAPAKSKKGTATTAKKPKAPAKKRKTDKPKPSAARAAGLKASSAGFSPAPSDTRSFSADLDDEDEDEDDAAAGSDDDVEGSGDVYCICRKPDNGTFMIGCDGQCDDWFHGKCVGIEERDKNLMDKYICPRCTAGGVGRTSWKRMCRRLGCRQPARVGRNAHKDGTTSKYCSDECGVLFFREMTARARGADQSKKTRRKSGAPGDHGAAQDLGHTRGGPLSAGEVRALLDLSDTATSFKAIGNGVLSPPATPAEDAPDANSVYTKEKITQLQEIDTKKDEARLRHRSLKDRLLFVGYAKTEATRVAAAKDLKPKDYCGFDSRINWTEEEFTEWRQSSHGQETFERGTLEPLTNGAAEHGEAHATDAADAIDAEDSAAVCSRKKCARHADWSKLAVDDIRFEMTDNSDHMRRLEQQEQEIRLQATMRAKHPRIDDGSVEWHHDSSITVNGLSHETTNDLSLGVTSPMQIDEVGLA